MPSALFRKLAAVFLPPLLIYTYAMLRILPHKAELKDESLIQSKKESSLLP